MGAPRSPHWAVSASERPASLPNSAGALLPLARGGPPMPDTVAADGDSVEGVRELPPPRVLPLVRAAAARAAAAFADAVAAAIALAAGCGGVYGRRADAGRSAFGVAIPATLVARPWAARGAAIRPRKSDAPPSPPSSSSSSSEELAADDIVMNRVGSLGVDGACPRSLPATSACLVPSRLSTEVDASAW